MSLRDTATGYGWVSIGLHWSSAIAIVYLLFLGSSIGNLEGDDRAAAIVRHTSIAIVSYALLVVRVAWRFFYGHPEPTPAQRGWAFTFGKWVHTTMLVALVLMLISGPAMHWAYGNPIVVFDWFVIPGPFLPSPTLAAKLHTVHTYGALLIFIDVLLHIGGVYKHTAFSHDGTLAKILIASKDTARRRWRR